MEHLYEWIKLEAKFPSKCGICGRDIPVGHKVYGTTDPAFVVKGKKWFMACPECYAEGPKPKAIKDVVEAVAAGISVGIPIPEREKMPTDVDSFVEFLRASKSEMETLPFPGLSFAETEPKKKEPGVDPHQTEENILSEAEVAAGIDAIVQYLDKKPKPKPWSILWIRENAVWGV